MKLRILLTCAALAAAGCGEAAEAPAVRDAAAAPGAPTPPTGRESAPGPAPTAEPTVDDGAATDDAPAPETPAGDAPAPAAPAVVAEAPATPAAEPQGSAAAILRRAEQAYDALRTLEADFTQQLTVPLLDTTQRSRGKMYVRRPDRFLMRFTDPAGDLVVADGQHVWLYYPSTDAKQVIRASVADGQRLDLQREFLSDPTSRFDATLNGTESVGGRSAHVLTLIPRAPASYQRVRIWVDARDALVRRFEITEANESVRRLELSNLRPNAPIDDQLFRFSPPEGTQVFSQ